ncbi:hypothetical protein E0765_00380 [Sulfuricurvum sp. IAE1]|uniref:SxtJ family membrane protein n=1 Tax=Sulfuricurvum sp. IAE1 TaxID=2546102 RepID=UPI0010457782|nr:SxtJ family membrane protein [Sulfuricurvum sp. IAE1]TDA69586.1 hypothetical protein E0765_00380 [Sulfuricurvum sp. IAE1]
MNRKNSELKKFSLLLSLVLFGTGIYTFTASSSTYPYFFAFSIIFTAIAYTKPGLLSPLYSGWMRIGHIMGTVSSKIILAILFYGVFTPIAIILKIRGKDLLNKKFDRNEASYWIERQEQPNSMKNQF